LTVHLPKNINVTNTCTQNHIYISRPLARILYHTVSFFQCGAILSTTAINCFPTSRPLALTIATALRETSSAVRHNEQQQQPFCGPLSVTTWMSRYHLWRHNFGSRQKLQKITRQNFSIDAFYNNQKSRQSDQNCTTR